MSAPRRRRRRPLVRRVTEISTKLAAARKASRLSFKQLAQELRIHPRTISRWEQGCTKPTPTLWPKVVAIYARAAPDLATELAALAGVASPVLPAPVIDYRQIDDAIVRAADTLDVAPKRVRAALRDILLALAAAKGGLAALYSLVDEKTVQSSGGA